MQGDYMIKCKVIKEFTLSKFSELKNIKRANLDTDGRLYVNDEFECDNEMAEYLTGKNDKGNVVVKVIEIIPEKVIEKEEVEQEAKKPTKKKTSKK